MIYKNLFKFKHLTLESEILFRYNFIILIDSVISGIVTFLFSGAVSCFPIQSFCPPKRRAKRISTSIRASYSILISYLSKRPTIPWVENLALRIGLDSGSILKL